MEDFVVDVASTDGQVVVNVAGEVDMQTAPRLKDCLFGLIDGGSTRIVVDLSATSFMDSTGLSVLVRALQRMRAHHGELYLRSPQARVSKVLDISGLRAVFPQG